MPFPFVPRTLCAALAGALALPCAATQAPDAPADERWAARVQATYVWQHKPGFGAPYTGPNSLRPDRETSYTFSTTAYLGWRPWHGGEFWFNPEGVQGRALSDVHGLGGLTNGELQKTAGPTLKFYRARLFYRHTADLGGEAEPVEADLNQFAGTATRRRLVVTAGNFAASDVFGTSDIAGDARTQFLNWSSLTWGHYDYAADARGYSWGLTAELAWDAWSLRAGRFLLPQQPNGLALDTSVRRRHGDQVELEHRHGEGDRAGSVKLLAFRDVARMAAWADNLAAPCDLQRLGDDEACVRRRQAKTGWGLALEQSLGPALRVLLRGGRADGRTETYAFTEIDASLFAAAQLAGTLWGRAQDTVGLSLAENRLSGGHREFLRRGGLGFFLGDGTLRYAPERLFEGYWSTRVTDWGTFSLGLQHIVHPGYNADRGPVNVVTTRLHAEF